MSKKTKIHSQSNQRPTHSSPNANAGNLPAVSNEQKSEFSMPEVLRSLHFLGSVYIGFGLATIGIIALGLFLFYPAGNNIAGGTEFPNNIQFNYFFALVSFLVFFIGISILSKNVNKKFGNTRIILLILIISSILFFGIGAVDGIYPNTPLVLTKNSDGASFVCSSLAGNAVPTVDDILSCNITYANLCNLRGNLSLSVIINKEDSNGINYINSVCKNEDLEFLDNRIMITQDGLNSVVYQLVTRQTGIPVYPNLQENIEYKAITQDAYDTRTNNRVQALILVVTLGLFSSIAAAHDFIEIWDKIV